VSGAVMDGLQRGPFESSQTETFSILLAFPTGGKTRMS